MGLVAGGKPVEPAASRGPARLGWAGWVGWGVAAALAIVATHFYQDREAIRASLSAQAGQIAQLSADRAQAREVVAALTDLSAQRATLTLTKAAAPPQPSGRATYLANRGTLIFLASHLDPLPAGKTYELWVIPASGAAPVPAGTFRPDARGNANVVTAKLDGVGAAKAFGITIEPSGGSSTPTMPIVLAGS
jgi:anti-sigma-K factor RskA